MTDASGDLADLLGRLEPVQQDAVSLVYFHGRSLSEAALILAADRAVVAAALAEAFGHIARHVLDDAGPGHPRSAGRSRGRTASPA